MGKVCFCYDILLITDNDSAIQMTKAHPLACNCKPGWVSSDAKPPTPSLAIARGGGSFSLRQRTTMTMTSHVGSLSSSASVCIPAPLVGSTHNDNDKPCRLVVVVPVPGCLACERGALYKYIIN